MSELKSWVRFNEADALATGDGLLSRLTANPALPRRLGDSLFSSFLCEKSDNEKYPSHLRSSAGVAVSVGERADPLLATALSVRTPMVNQPVEVPAVRPQFAQWLGLGSQRPDLVTRFGRGLSFHIRYAAPPICRSCSTFPTALRFQLPCNDDTR